MIRLSDGYVSFEDGKQVGAVVFDEQEYPSVGKAYEICINHAAELLRGVGAEITDIDLDTIYYVQDEVEKSEQVVLYDEAQKVVPFEPVYWYAVMRDDEDTDWGYGSFDYDEALEMLRPYVNGYIVKVEEGDDPVAVDEIEIPFYKDRSGGRILPGDVLSDTDGTYKVTDVSDRGVDVVEIELDEDGHEEVAGNEITFTRSEVRNCDRL